MIKKKKKTKRMRKITAGELSEVLKEHERWIDTDKKEGKRADLYKADLSHADLGIRWGGDKATNLSEADLSHADLRYAWLEGANLRGAKLSDARLSDACLEGVEGLTKASLIEKPSKVVINREKVIKDNFIIGG